MINFSSNKILLHAYTIIVLRIQVDQKNVISKFLFIFNREYITLKKNTLHFEALISVGAPNLFIVLLNRIINE